METLAFCVFVVLFLALIFAHIYDRVSTRGFWIAYAILCLLSLPWTGWWAILLAGGASVLAFESSL